MWLLCVELAIERGHIDRLAEIESATIYCHNLCMVVLLICIFY